MFLHGFLISIYFVHPVCIRLLYILQHDLHCPQNKSVLILVLCILLFFKIKYNVIIGLIMTGIIEVRISLAGGFWNTALDLAALCFASSLKFISYQLTPLYYVEQFPL
uniref:Uncharacterized protein n=1 Tax=Trichobilharzia regenti TaxID=157069 RepID=A0AA85IXB8_TRIRE|nr:unnamed protein product [Trichobilharzia regenti]